MVNVFRAGTGVVIFLEFAFENNYVFKALKVLIRVAQGVVLTDPCGI